PNIRVAALQLAVAKALHLRIQFLTQAADLAFRNAIQSQRFHQIVHAARANPLDVGFAHCSDQRTLGSLARLEHARKEAPVSHARDTQVNTADPSIPAPLAVAVSFTLSLGRALITLRTEVLGDLEFHEGLRHDSHTFTQRVEIR